MREKKASGGQGTMREILIPAVILTVTCIVIALLLAVTNMVTAPRIADLQVQTAAESRKLVLADAASFSEERTIALDGVDYTYCEGLDASGNCVGYVFTTSAKGYGGDVVVMSGVDTNGTVTGIQTTELNETAGLGMKAAEDSFLSQFKGKTAGIGVAKNNPGDNDIQALTGATITSRAVTDSVNTALELYQLVKGGGTIE